MKYHIARVKNFGMFFWHVYLGDEFVFRANTKRECISWILEQEAKQ